MPGMKKFFFGVVAAFATLAGPSFAQITVTDIEGREVTLPQPAERVVLGFYYEDFLAVVGPGAIDRVVALSLLPWKGWRPAQFAAYAEVLPKLASIPDAGYALDGTFSVEKVIAARPDLVILPSWSHDAIAVGIEQIEATGIPVVIIDYNSQSIARHIKSTLVLGAVMGAEARAEKLAENYRATWEDIRARIKKAGPTDKKVYVELAQQGPSVIGNSYGDSMWGELVEKLGGINIADGQVGNWGPLNPEYVLSQQPDLIFLAGSAWENQAQAVRLGFGADPAAARARMAAYPTRPGWSALPAVKNGKVFAIYHGGSRTLSDYVYAQYIAKQLYPEAFKDVHPAENLRRYYKKWLPIEADGVFMLHYQAGGQ